jgi:hypothetical protein
MVARIRLPPRGSDGERKEATVAISEYEAGHEAERAS